MRIAFPVRMVLCAGIVLASTGVAHTAQVHRCVTNGTVTYSDMPCPTANPAPGKAPQTGGTTTQSTATAAKFGGFYGGWTGQAQYQATARSQSLDAAHAVVTLTLVIASDGKVTGESKANGCRALGIASPQSLQTLKLDVSLTGCQYAGFNRRYAGTFGLPPGKDYATFNLLAYDVHPGTPSVMYDIKATMRR
jgi:hypothetical protein